ncbi:sensor histidine kinase [Trichloromonas sp.]|uniref:sensor histidine kinase n=1 Tax=Trichloromonas sp. TaxID=3069249 RepID=UPI003D81B984
MDNRESIDFVVGEEKRLIDVLSESDVMPLLESAVQAGISRALVVDGAEAPLWSAGRETGGLLGKGPGVLCCPLILEGEPVGQACFVGGSADPGVLKAIAQVVSGALKRLLHANLKRMLTTEIHTRVVNQSYDELKESNLQLSLSEKKYRDLAESLEVRVQQRTEELKRAYARLIQQEKMASIGQLAAGVAHEINNPMGFVLSNLQTLQKYVTRFTDMLEYYRQAVARGEGGAALEAGAASRWRELKLDFISQDLAELLAQSIAGAERVKKIVADLRGFSHVDEMGCGTVNLNEELERTLSVLHSEIPADARILRQFGELPGVKAEAGLLCQVFLNLIRNALQARPEGLQLLLRSELEGESIRLSFVDNGPGVPDEIRSRIFEPFFTTREVGKGMGMGLTVAYDVVNRLGGTIEVQSRPGRGAAFILLLPVIRSEF